MAGDDNTNLDTTAVNSTLPQAEPTRKLKNRLPLASGNISKLLFATWVLLVFVLSLAFFFLLVDENRAYYRGRINLGPDIIVKVDSQVITRQQVSDVQKVLRDQKQDEATAERVLVQAAKAKLAGEELGIIAPGQLDFMLDSNKSASGQALSDAQKQLQIPGLVRQQAATAQDGVYEGLLVQVRFSTPEERLRAKDIANQAKRLLEQEASGRAENQNDENPGQTTGGQAVLSKLQALAPPASRTLTLDSQIISSQSESWTILMPVELIPVIKNKAKAGLSDVGLHITQPVGSTNEATARAGYYYVIDLIDVSPSQGTALVEKLTAKMAGYKVVRY